MQAADLFHLPDSLADFQRFFPAEAPPWTWIPAIAQALATITPQLPDNIPAGVSISGPVFLHPSVKLPPQAVIDGPAWIGPGCQIRPGAWIRGNVIAGKNCVLGHACEFKNCLLLDAVQAPHFNYVGDSILGNHSHLGAGVICANLRLDQQPVKVKTSSGLVQTGLKKLGAILGDAAEVGCNSVLQPGSILYPRAIVLSGIPFSGTLEAETMVAATVTLRKLPRPSCAQG